MIAQSKPYTEKDSSQSTNVEPIVQPAGLEITLDSHDLPVSYLSSLLRVMQATLREVAKQSESTRDAFSQQTQPVLLLSTQMVEDDLVLQFTFADPLGSISMDSVAQQVFASYLEQFGDFLKSLPQRGLWGESKSGSRRPRYETDMARRMNQMRIELRRFSRARLSFGEHSIFMEGDRMEIE